MHDIRPIRDNPEAFDAALARRGLPPQAEALVAIDERRRATIAAAQEAQARRNDLSKQIGQAKATKDEARAAALMTEVAGLKARLPELEDEERQLTLAFDVAIRELTLSHPSDTPSLAANISLTARFTSLKQTASTPLPPSKLSQSSQGDFVSMESQLFWMGSA